MNIVHVCNSDTNGGAARAAYRLHRSLIKASVDSSMLVCEKSSDDQSVQVSRQNISLQLLNKVKNRLNNKRWMGFSAPHQLMHSTANFSSGILNVLQSQSCDLVNLHWLGSNTLTIEEIGRISQPIVWTLHDMWAFCGAEHLSPDDSTARFRVGYQKDNRSPGESGPDMNRWVWERKQKAWRKPMTVVCPSRWLTECARDSVLFRGWSVHCIPNSLDVNKWRPFSREYSRELLNLPRDGQLILFGAANGEGNLNKGEDLLRNALNILYKNGVRDLQLVIFGKTAPQVSEELPFPVKYLGRLHDDVSMIAAYNAADVMIVPSRQDNLPQTAVEAQSCGIPVVAFNVGGLPDIVSHRETGFLARALAVDDLADGIAWVLADEQRRLALSRAAREAAISKYSEAVVAKSYSELYEQVLSASFPLWCSFK